MVIGLLQEHLQQSARGRSRVSLAVTARCEITVYPNKSKLNSIRRLRCVSVAPSGECEFTLAERCFIGSGVTVTLFDGIQLE